MLEYNYIARVLLIIFAATALHPTVGGQDIDDDDYYEELHGLRIPPQYSHDGKVSLHFEGLRQVEYGDEKDRSRAVIDCRIVNFSNMDIYFLGYALDQPWHRLQQWSQNGTHEGFWVEYDVGWFCGTGLYEPVLYPNKSAAFYVPLPDNVILGLRVGVEISAEVTSEIWTPHIVLSASNYLARD